MSINGGHTLYGAMEHYDNFAGGMIGLGSNIQAFSGGGKKKGSKKKAQKRTHMRKPLSRKAKHMSKMRINNIKKLTKRQKKLEKRLKNRKKRENIINSLTKSTKLPKTLESSLSRSMRKFISSIPKTDSSSTLPSWPTIESENVNKKPSTKSFFDARKGLADMLNKKPLYPVESDSVLKFSDYKSSLTPKEKASLKAKNKKKGNTR
jgi:hypothetical protein